MKKRIRYYLFLTLITPICFELALRVLGYSAYQQLPYSIVSKPNMCIEASADLGFSLGEGTYNVSVNGAPTYTATHTDGKRITRDYSLSDSISSIFVMGCSFTYGMGVMDSVSFPYQLQSHFSDLNIQNFGVPGFGTTQSYLQLENELRNGNVPGLVIVNFCDFHHERNSLIPRFRNSLVMGYQRSNEEAISELTKSSFPYLEKGEMKTVEFKEMYSNWAGRETFASVNYFQTTDDKRLTSRINTEQNSLDIFLRIRELCKEQNIQFIVTGLTRNRVTKTFLAQLKRSNINVVDISLDLRKKKYNQLPYDTHPNSRAHDHFAKKLIPEIRNWINSQSLAN